MVKHLLFGLIKGIVPEARGLFSNPGSSFQHVQYYDTNVADAFDAFEHQDLTAIYASTVFETRKAVLCSSKSCFLIILNA